MRKFLVFFLLLSPSLLSAQGVAVAPLELQRAQFLNGTGVPLAAGCVNFFATGSSTPQAIYADSTGTTQLPNPLTLDAAGEASVWLTNTGYDIVLNTGVVGQPCSSQLGTQLYREVNKNPFAIINIGSNFIVASGTSDPSGTPGELTYRTDIPCLRVFTSIWDCVATLTATQTLTNKTLTTPTIVTPSITNGGSWTGSPSLSNPALNGVNAQTGGTYTFLATDEQKLVTFNSATAVAATLPQATTSGFGAGTVFHVKNIGAGSTTITPTVSMIDGASNLVLVTGQGLDIYSDGTNYQTQRGTATAIGYKFEASNVTPVTVGNTVTPTNMMTFSVPPNEMGAAGQTFYFDGQGIIGDAGPPTITIAVMLDAVTVCAIGPTLAGANLQPWAIHGFFTVVTTGAGGTVTGCHIDWSSTPSGGGHVGNEGGAGSPQQTVTVNTTVTHTFALQVTWSAATANNTITQNSLVVYRIG